MTGPYAPAVLRFQLAFPQNYPEVPPLILFTNDVFHPLVTPLTTYTFSTSASSADPVSATDEERLLPGGFSLRHGFPSWFAHSAKSKLGHVGSLVSQSNQTGANEATQRAAIAASSGSSSGPGPPQSVFLPPPKDEGSSVEEALPTILEVLRYIKDVFEDETLLDELPIEAAGNPGAWHAWQAHRKRTKSSKSSADGLRSQLNTPRKEKGAAAKLRAAGWNWDGVWAERVKKGVSNSLTDSMLYGGVDGDDLVGFSTNGLIQ